MDMRRVGDQAYPLIVPTLVSVLAHLGAMAIPVRGDGDMVSPRVFMPQASLPVVEVRFRAIPPVHLELSLPAGPGVPVTDAPPPQLVSAEPIHETTMSDVPGVASVFPGTYFRPSEVNEPPYPLTVAPIDIDDSSVGPNGATFSIEVLVDEGGRVDGIALISGSVPGSIWSQVEREFGRTTYRPARILDQPVKSRLRIELSIPPAPKP